jgi:hypothetical protein
MMVNGTHLSRFMDEEKQRNDGYDQANTESAWATSAQPFAARRRPAALPQRRSRIRDVQSIFSTNDVYEFEYSPPASCVQDGKHHMSDQLAVIEAHTLAYIRHVPSR